MKILVIILMPLTTPKAVAAILVICLATLLGADADVLAYTFKMMEYAVIILKSLIPGKNFPELLFYGVDRSTLGYLLSLKF